MIGDHPTGGSIPAMLDTAELTDDIAVPKAMLVVAEARSQRKDGRIAQLEKLVQAGGLRAEIEKSDPDQFELALEHLEAAIAAVHAEQDAADRAARRPAKPRSQQSWFASQAPAADRADHRARKPVSGCGGGLHCIGEVSSERARLT